MRRGLEVEGSWNMTEIQKSGSFCFLFLGVVLIHGRTKFLDAEGNKNYLPSYNVNTCLTSETFLLHGQC